MNSITSLSSANQTYINTKKQTLPQENTTRPERNFNKKALAIGAVALGAIAVGGLIAAGKFKTAEQLAEHIDFTPARTLEEAKEFASKNLHIRKFKLTDLDTANYVNEALVNFNNNLSTDHRRIVRTVVPSSLKKLNGILAVNGFQKLFVNEEFFKNIDDEINKAIKTIKENGISKKLFSFPDSETLSKMTLKEKMSLYGVMEINGSNLEVNSSIANLLSKSKVKDFLKANPDYPQTIEDFLKLEARERQNIAKEIMRKTNTLPINTNSGGPFRLLNHEIGHILHQNNIGTELFAKYSDYGKLADGGINTFALWRKFRNEIGNKLFYEVMGNVTPYAATTPAEFVAEVYSFLCNGVKFSDDIMELYKKYGGPIPKNMI